MSELLGLAKTVFLLLVCIGGVYLGVMALGFYLACWL
jgi:hypothetical protein